MLGTTRSCICWSCVCRYSGLIRISAKQKSLGALKMKTCQWYLVTEAEAGFVSIVQYQLLVHYCAKMYFITQFPPQTLLAFTPIVLRYGRGKKNILFQDCIHFAFNKAHSFTAYCQSVSLAQISTHTREHIHKARLKKQLQFLIKALLIPLCKTWLHKCTQWGKRENEGGEKRGGRAKKKMCKCEENNYIYHEAVPFILDVTSDVTGRLWR